jgi:DNA-binding IclR family transcriptional regulator
VENEKNQDSVRAVDRALDILLAFRPGEDELTVAELLKRVSLSRPTLYRLLGTLEGKQFVLSSGEPQRFRLGPAVAQLAHVWGAGLNLTALAQPVMRHIWEATQETVALFVAEGLWRTCVAEMESPQPLSYRRGVGYRQHLTMGASGRAILAFMPLDADAVASAVRGQDIDPQRLRQDLARIREQGYATSSEELIKGAVAVAAPFFNGANQVAGSICIFGPSVRLLEPEVERYVTLLRTASEALSHSLGQSRPVGTARAVVQAPA